MGFWAKLFGREVDTTVSDYGSHVTSASGTTQVGPSVGGPFRMTVEDHFSIKRRGTVVTGRVAVGTVSVGDVLEWTHPDGRAMSTKVSSIEAFRKTLDTASAGEMIGLLFRDPTCIEMGEGTVLSRP